jgi:amino acid permease
MYAINRPLLSVKKTKGGPVKMAHNTDGNKSVTPIDNALIEKLKKSRNKWALIFLVLVCLAYIVPYTLLTNVPKVYGAFLFWWVYIAAVVVCILTIIKDWRD